MWSDRRNGKQQQSYAARIDVVTGDEAEVAASSLREEVVTDRVKLVPGKVEYDEVKGTSELTVEIRNIGSTPLYAPLKLRAKRVTTPSAAETKFIGADVGGTGPGATWDFSALMGTRKRLDPQVSTEPRTIVMHTSLAGGLDAAFEFEVLARVPASSATGAGSNKGSKAP